VASISSVQPFVVTLPFLESMATRSLSLGSLDKNSSLAAVPIIIFLAPFASIFFAFSISLIPPPTLQSAILQICLIKSSLSPFPKAASRSIKLIRQILHHI
jgi:hypothetical protein